jgi:hypothetical protein
MLCLRKAWLVQYERVPFVKLKYCSAMMAAAGMTPQVDQTLCCRQVA